MNPDTNGQVVPTLDHVIGQQRAVAILRTAIDAYFHDRTKATEEQASAFHSGNLPPGK